MLSLASVAHDAFAYNQKPFDAGRVPVGGKLPDNCEHSLDQLFSAWQKRQTVKGEYETTQHFEQRKRARRNKPLFGQVYVTSNICISLPNLHKSYDADTSTLTFEVTASPDVLDDNLMIFDAPYEGGDIPRIWMRNKDDFEFTPLHDYSIGDYGQGMIAQIVVPPDEAKKMRRNVSAVVTATLVEPAFESDHCNMKFKSVTFYDDDSLRVYAQIFSQSR